MARYIDLLDSDGHRRDHGFDAGAEFDVKLHGRRIDIPDRVRDVLSADEIDSIWWDEANLAREDLEASLHRRYQWTGRTMFVGRGPGWLAIEDTVGRRRNWEPIQHAVTRRLKSFVRMMESEDFWESYL